MSAGGLEGVGTLLRQGGAGGGEKLSLPAKRKECKGTGSCEKKSLVLVRFEKKNSLD